MPAQTVYICSESLKQDNVYKLCLQLLEEHICLVLTS